MKSSQAYFLKQCLFPLLDYGCHQVLLHFKGRLLFPREFSITIKPKERYRGTASAQYHMSRLIDKLKLMGSTIRRARELARAVRHPAFNQEPPSTWQLRKEFTQVRAAVCALRDKRSKKEHEIS